VYLFIFVCSLFFSFCGPGAHRREAWGRRFARPQINSYVYIYMCICIYIYIYTYMFIYIYRCIFLFVFVPFPSVSAVQELIEGRREAGAWPSPHIYIQYLYISIYLSLYIYAYIYIYIYIYIFIYLVIVFFVLLPSVSAELRCSSRVDAKRVLCPSTNKFICLYLYVYMYMYIYIYTLTCSYI